MEENFIAEAECAVRTRTAGAYDTQQAGSDRRKTALPNLHNPASSSRAHGDVYPPSGMVEVLMKNGFLSLSYAESEKESHMPDRQDLKYQLFSSRKVNGTTFCPICRQPVSNSRPFDMHEAILTRGDVQGCRPEVQDAIMVRQNCVLVHHEKCHELAATDWGQLKCLQHLILFEGYSVICTWLNQNGLNSSRETRRS